MVARARPASSIAACQALTSIGLIVAGCLPVRAKNDSTARDLSRSKFRRHSLTPFVVASAHRLTALHSATASGLLRVTDRLSEFIDFEVAGADDDSLDADLT